jgi:FtsH-binding integral membrane protein
MFLLLFTIPAVLMVGYMFYKNPKRGIIVGVVGVILFLGLLFLLSQSR